MKCCFLMADQCLHFSREAVYLVSLLHMIIYFSKGCRFFILFFACCTDRHFCLAARPHFPFLGNIICFSC